MKILIVGSGGREHALVAKISQNPNVKKFFVAPGNGGIAQHAACVPIAVDAIGDLVAFAKKENIDLTVVGPELPLTLGIVDAFNQAGLACFGPSERASLIEGSKVYIKEFCTRHKIPTASFFTFSEAAHALAYVAECNTYPIVIKVDGLAQGKGVVVAQNFSEASAAIEDMLVTKKFGGAGGKIIIEDFLPGEEASFFIITDGEHFVEFPVAQDHKRIFDNDQGPNTGGMGAYAPAPLVSEKIRQRIIDQIVYPTLVGLKEENRKFVGFLFIGLMIHNGTPYVIEYNCRLGDPETQVILPLLQNDLVELMQAALAGKLGDHTAQFKKQNAVTVVLASGGYPAEYKKGFTIEGLDQAFAKNIQVLHAGTSFENNHFKTQGGRVLTITAVAETLQQAIHDVYGAVKKISWPGKHHRTDIGQKGLKS